MENAQVFGIPQPQIFVSERTPEGAELTQMDYEVYPQALEHVLRKVAEAVQGRPDRDRKRHCHCR